MEDTTKRPPIKRHVPRKRNPPKTRADSSIIIHAGYISTFILLVLTLLIYDVIFLTNSDIDVDFHSLKTELVNNVHNQSEAVSTIIKSLQKLQNHEQIVGVVNFIGSSGVGKTFVSNILKRHFVPSVYESRVSDEKLSSTIRDSKFSYNLVVFDDLTIDDLDSLLSFLKLLPEDVNVLVICIFNIQETDQFLNRSINYDQIDIIEAKFNKSGIIHESAKFHEFTPDEVTEWIVKQLLIKGVDVEFHKKIVESLLANQNVKYHGLKGLSSKLNLEL